MRPLFFVRLIAALIFFSSESSFSQEMPAGFSIGSLSWSRVVDNPEQSETMLLKNEVGSAKKGGEEFLLMSISGQSIAQVADFYFVSAADNNDVIRLYRRNRVQDKWTILLPAEKVTSVYADNSSLEVIVCADDKIKLSPHMKYGDEWETISAENDPIFRKVAAYYENGELSAVYAVGYRGLYRVKRSGSELIWANDWTSAITVDRETGTVYVGTWGEGLWRYDGRGQTTRLKSPPHIHSIAVLNGQVFATGNRDKTTTYQLYLCGEKYFLLDETIEMVSRFRDNLICVKRMDGLWTTAKP